MNNKLAFLNQEAPAHYVAGLGRGATGFTTRSDIGPAAEGPDEETLQAAIAAQAAARVNGEEPDDDGRYQDPENETGLFANAPYDRDDEEADRAYDLIEEAMRTRRNKKNRYDPWYVPQISSRVANNKRAQSQEDEPEEEVRRDKNGMVLPPIRSQFAELKRALAHVTDEEWANLPEPGDLTRKHKRQKLQQQQEQRFYAVPDSVLAGAQASTQYETSIDVDAFDTGATTDFVAMGQARDRILGITLDQLSANTGMTTSIDRTGYETGLKSLEIKSTEEIENIKAARQMFAAAVRANSESAATWISAARLEERDGKMNQARKLSKQGCEKCPKNEDIWIEQARLNDTDNAKKILAEAIKHVPQSSRIWLQAMNLESEVANKQRVIRKALEMLPKSVTLWKKAVDLEEDPNHVKLLLARATELIPSSIELWLALARVESYANAKRVLNQARKQVPTSYEIWVAAARLEEQQGNIDRVSVVVARAMKDLTALGGMLSRDQWLKEAEDCEKDGGILTAQSIVGAILGLHLDEEDKKDTWMDDADGAIARACPETARAIFAYALREMKSESSIWRKAAQFEKDMENQPNAFAVLEKGVVACPDAEILWLMYAKETWLSGDIMSARKILERAFEENQDSEDIWLAAVKLETESGEVDKARQFLARARREAGSERIWIRSAVLERQNGNLKHTISIVEEGLELFANSEKLWLIKGQALESMSNVSQARDCYNAAVKQCKHSVPLWVAAAKLEETNDRFPRARDILDRGRRVNKANELLWYHSIRLERCDDKLDQAKALISKALQECPTSGLLWAERIMQEDKESARRARAMDALHKCDNDPYLITAIGRMFWQQKKLDKAARYLGQSIQRNIDIGDSWAWHFKFLTETISSLQTESEKEERLKKVSELITEATKADPKHGLLWPAVSKADAMAKADMKSRLQKFADGVKV